MLTKRQKDAHKYLQTYIEEYTEREFIYPDYDFWKDFFTNIMVLKRTYEDLINKTIMDKDDLESYKLLPEKFTIYRGGVDDTGLSWTLNKSKAKWFCNRFKGMQNSKLETENLKLFSKEIYKKEAVLYTNDRSEEEIIYIGG